MFFSLSKEDIKKELQDNLDFLHSMTVKEYTLYKKWVDINQQEWIKKNQIKISDTKTKIWVAKDNSSYIDIKPKLIYVNKKEDQLIWRILRTFISTAPWKQSPGRLLKFYVIDDITKKYLGVISFGSDFISIGGRDKKIKWTTDQKLSGMLKYTLMGSSLVPTQPLGYNFAGGKLITLLACSNFVETCFNKKYNETLTGITTTSLYGSYSQYTRLKYWEKCNTSEGKVSIEPTEDIYIKIKNWYKSNFPIKYKEISSKSHPKNRLLSLIYKELKIKTYNSNAKRGVFWCPLYNNTNAFLRKDDTKLSDHKFDNSIESLTTLWKEKYAKKRAKKIIIDKLFYNDIIDTSWEDVKIKYLNDVGR